MAGLRVSMPGAFARLGPLLGNEYSSSAGQSVEFASSAQRSADPCGACVEQFWRRTGLLGLMRAKQTRGELLRSIGSGDLPNFLRDGRAQVGLLYLSEARQLDDSVRTIEHPPEQDLHEQIRFVVGAVNPVVLASRS